MFLQQYFYSYCRYFSCNIFNLNHKIQRGNSLKNRIFHTVICASTKLPDFGKGMVINMIHYIIFDLDGTLIDTELAILKTWQETLYQYGYDYPIDALKCVLGVTNKIGLSRLNATVDNNFANLWQINYERHASETNFFDNILPMLQQLKGKGYSLGVVTSRNRNEYKKYFTRFDFSQYFDAVVLEEDTQKHKPDPEPLYKYMQMLNTRKEQCIYIGDMPSDIKCANNAGILSGLVKWNKSDIECNDATYNFYSPEEVNTFFD